MFINLNDIKELKELKELKERLNSGQQSCDQSNDITAQKSNTDNVIVDFNDSIEENNALQKYTFRNKLLRLVSWLIWVQMIFFNIIILIVISSVVFQFSFIKNNISASILDFLKYYISVTVVELLGMLWFVMKYVFKDRTKESVY